MQELHLGNPPWEGKDMLTNVLGVNFMGVVNGCHAFVPEMLKQKVAGAVINTGSKQGITRPPGNYAYNISKASVVAYTEALSHAFLNEKDCQLNAHLLIPAFVYTPMISAFCLISLNEETVTFFMESLKNGDFIFYVRITKQPAKWMKKEFSGMLMTSLKIGRQCRDGILITQTSSKNL